MIARPHHLAAGRRRGGFTLVELALVASIIGVAAAIAVPKFSSAARTYRADQAARRIVADVELARQEAMATSSKRTLQFDASAIAYSILESTSLDRGTSVYTVNLKAAPYEATALVVKQAAGSTLSSFTFDGYGTINIGGSIAVSVGGVSRVVAVDAVSGKAAVQ